MCVSQLGRAVAPFAGAAGGVIGDATMPRAWTHKRVNSPWLGNVDTELTSPMSAFAVAIGQ